MLISEICFKYHSKYMNKFGDNTIVFIQKGTFYETYATDTEGPNVDKLGDLLSIKVTRTNTKKNVPVSRKVPYMLGIPVIAIHKYLNILLDNNYTVVLYDEIAVDGIIERKKSGIYTKGVHLDRNGTSFVLSIYLVEEKQLKSTPKLACGIALIEVSTGKLIIHEAHSSITNENYAIEEIRLMIAYYSPKEIIIHYKGTGLSTESILRNIDLKKDDSIKFINYPLKDSETFRIIDNNFFNINFQNKYFGDVFNIPIIRNGKLSPIEVLGLENKIYATIALLVLLQYIKEHNKFLVTKMEKPTTFTKNKNLVLGNNAIEQLHLLTTHLDSYGSIRSLLDVIDETSTPMGKRFLKESLLHPLSQENKEEMNNRYELIDWLIKKKRYETVKTYLSEINDLEVLHRKFTMGILAPRDFFKLNNYYKSIKKIFKFLDSNIRAKIFSDDNLTQFKEYRNSYLKIFSIERMSQFYKLNESESFFKKGIYSDIDKLQHKVNYFFTVVNQLKDKLNDMMGATETDIFIKLHSTKKLGYHFSVSSGRAKILETKLKNKIKLVANDGEEIILSKDDLDFRHNGKLSRILIKTLSNVDDDVVILQNNLYDEVKNKYLEHLREYDDKYKKMFRKLVYAVSFIDFLVSGAIIADKFSYVRPIIESKDNMKSFIDCQKLRNPLIERINIESEYIGHDIKLGNIDGNNGMLLYGLNSGGKSSLMKAIGMAVVMAQIGYFVSAERFSFEPYMGIYARITGNDNPFKGLSGLAVEIVELNNIIKNVGDKCLFIGDEVCRTTDIQSAIAMVAATLIILSEASSSFIFASHLHQLVELEEVKNLKNMNIYHILVSQNNDSYIYDRVLREGSGPSDYGLEFAKQRIKDKKFLTYAEKIKDQLNVKSIFKVSKYNNNLIVDKCHICEYSPSGKNDKELETHHINFQKNCKDGKINTKPHISMNHLSNLVVLCRPCHEKVHEGRIKIHGFVETSKGMKLKYE